MEEKESQGDKVKYPILAIVTSALCLIGIIVSGISVLYLITNTDSDIKILQGLSGAISGLMIFAFSGAIDVLIGIEKNTRN